MEIKIVTSWAGTVVPPLCPRLGFQLAKMDSGKSHHLAAKVTKRRVGVVNSGRAAQIVVIANIFDRLRSGGLRCNERR